MCRIVQHGNKGHSIHVHDRAKPGFSTWLLRPNMESVSYKRKAPLGALNGDGWI